MRMQKCPRVQRLLHLGGKTFIYISAKKNAKPDPLGGNGKYVVEDQSSPVDGEVIQRPQYSVTAGRRKTTK